MTNDQISITLEEIEGLLTCAICCDILQSPLVLECGHCYCNSCIKGLLSSSSDGCCPTCRRPGLLEKAHVCFDLHSISSFFRSKMGLSISNARSPYVPHSVLEPSRWLRLGGKSTPLELPLSSCLTTFNVVVNDFEFEVTLTYSHEFKQIQCVIRTTHKPIDDDLVFDYEITLLGLIKKDDLVITSEWSTKQEEFKTFADVPQLLVLTHPDNDQGMMKGRIVIGSWDRPDEECIEIESQSGDSRIFPLNSAFLSVDVEVCGSTVGDIFYSPVYKIYGLRWQVLVAVGDADSPKSPTSWSSEDKLTCSIRCNSDLSHLTSSTKQRYDIRFFDALMNSHHAWDSFILNNVPYFINVMTLNDIMKLAVNEDCVSYAIGCQLYLADTCDDAAEVFSLPVCPFPGDCPFFSFTFDRSWRTYYGHRTYSKPMIIDGYRYQLMVQFGRNFLTENEEIGPHNQGLLSTYNFSCFVRLNEAIPEDKQKTFEHLFSLYGVNEGEEAKLLESKYTPYTLRHSNPTWGFPSYVSMIELDNWLNEYDCLELKCFVNSYDVAMSDVIDIAEGPLFSTQLQFPINEFGRFFSPVVLFDNHKFVILVSVAKLANNDIKLGVFWKYNGTSSTDHYNLEFELANADDSKTIHKSTSYSFSPGKSSWGFPEIFAGKLFDGESGFVNGGGITVKATIAIGNVSED
ncbi:hypothetical protein GEMRC1_012032 [Eukaryota sp. GEM-RC1]